MPPVHITATQLFPQTPRSLSATLSTLGLVPVPMTVQGRRRWVMIISGEFDAFVEGAPHVARHIIHDGVSKLTVVRVWGKTVIRLIA